MIVDDDADILVLMAEILQKRYPHMIITTASNGKEAIDVTASDMYDDLPDIVLTDMKMPVMDGAELCKVLKTRYGPRTKVVLMTALKETRGLFDKVMRKPLEFDNLFAYIDNNFPQDE
jgi:two-component system response regulator YesN